VREKKVRNVLYVEQKSVAKDRVTATLRQARQSGFT
jgi:hypothetical protein